jgi:hypothetical protein
MFSVFDSVERGGKIEFVINEQKFNSSLAKTEIKKIVDYIVEDIEDYNREIAEWEQEEKERQEEEKYRQEEEKYRQEEEEDGTMEPGKEEEESDIDKLVKQSLYGGSEETEGEVDYADLTPRELQELIDAALDEGDYKKVQMLAQYMKEGKEIYLKELERINEGHSFHTRIK